MALVESDNQLAGDALFGKTVLVTGGSGGIGRAICHALAGFGACVADASIEYREQQPLFRVAPGEISRRGVDVSDDVDVARLFNNLDQHFGRIDILINNAGGFLFKSLLEIEPQEWRNLMAVNLDGAFFCTREALQRMVKNGGGQIINIGSIAGQLPLPGNAAYGTSKAALKMLTEIIHAEYAAQGIKASWLALGAVDTGLWNNLDAVTRERLQPERVAEAVIFMIRQNITGRLEELCLLPDYRYQP